MFSMFAETGPILYMNNDASKSQSMQDQLVPNMYSWHNLSDIFYVDQPVGTGFSTVDSTGWAVDENTVGQDFVIIVQIHVICH